MIDDDSEEKIRRNLLFISTLTVLLSWFDISANNIFPEYLKINRVPDWKVDVALLGLIIYFAIRFRFSKLAKDLFRYMKAEYRVLQRQRVINYLNDGLKRFVNFNESPKVFTDSMGNHKEYIFNSMLIPEENLILEWLVIDKVNSSISLVKPFEGYISTVAKIISSEGGEIYTTGNYLKYKFGVFEKNILKLKCLLHMVVYSKASVELIVPLVMTIAAVVALGCKLIVDGGVYNFIIVNLFHCECG